MSDAPVFSREGALGASSGHAPGHGLDAAVVAAQLQKSLAALPAAKLDRIFTLADELREEEGAYQSVRDDRATGEVRAARGFDILPVVIAGEEWARIERGLRQRVRAWNLFLRDVYSEQEILKAGIVPYDIVYADPNFHRGCARLPSPLTSYLQLTAFDLQQTQRGNWMVVEEHLGVADGASYALKKRQLLRQVAPRLFDTVEILPIDDFAAQVLDVLQELVRLPDGDPRGVLLAQGSGDEYYLDDAALARQMGVPIVQGTDLVVLDSRLYLKTIGGVERVDVLLRRMTTSLLDPVTFDPASRYGVPGLLSCVRKGTLAVANGLGSDLANNRALAAYLPLITEYYLGEKLELPSPQVLEMRDLDVRELVSERRDDYVVRHVFQRTADHEWVLRDVAEEEWPALWRRFEAAPSEYVARKLPALATQPCWTPGGTQSLPVTVRAFTLGMDRVSPCALAWTGEAATLPKAQHSGDRVKDVWILQSASAPGVSAHAQAVEDPKRLRLTSRVAEAFFWMGRYVERAEATTRMLRIVQMQPWPLSDTAAARQRRPLWAAIAKITGHAADFFVRPGSDAITAREVPFYFLLDRGNGGSVLSYLFACRQNAENVREHFPPEVWSVLNHLYLELALAAEQGTGETVRMAMEDRTLHQDILDELDELTGALEKHMLHNDAWHFWQLGVSAERGLLTLQTLKQGFTPEVDGEPVIGPVSSTNLDLILQMLAGQYAYRSLYHARPVAARVARLLLQDTEFPRSLAFCLGRMKAALQVTLADRQPRTADTPLKHCGQVITELNDLDIAAYFPPAKAAGHDEDEDELADTPTIDYPRQLNDLIDLLLDFNVLISDHYLDHQVMFREPELFDLPPAR